VLNPVRGGEPHSTTCSLIRDSQVGSAGDFHAGEGQPLTEGRLPGSHWELLQEHTKANQGYPKMVEVLPDDSSMWPKSLAGMKKYQSKLTAVDGILLFGDRVVIPKSLSMEVLGTLHSGHQGITSMLARRVTSVWWPLMSEDVAKVREACMECHSNAPSQTKEPPVSPPKPEYLFQQMCRDFFSIKGH
jgi:hypothetical protein